MVQKLSFSVAAGDRGLRLDQFLAREMPRRLGAAISRRRIRRLIADGAVYVEDRRVRIASRSVARGRRIDVFVDSAKLDAAPTAKPEVDVERLLLFEDEHLLAVDKPSGIAAQATVDDDVHHLLARVRDFLGRRGRPPPHLALVHRLDYGTSGVQLLAKSRRANAVLSAAFRERRVDKVYLALCAAGDPPLADEWTVSDRLVFRPRGLGQSRRTVSVTGGGRPAETRFEVRERLPGAALIAARPKTGRTHQIRVHLAGSGAAVLGDSIYGSPPGSTAAPRLMLHAAELRLRHPIGGGPLELVSPLPDDFRRLLEALRADPSGRRSTSIASP